MSRTGRRLNLTPDPLSKRESKLLANWWRARGWDVERRFSHRRRGKTYFHVTATKE